MKLTPRHSEIDHHTIKLIVGIIAISLALLISLFSGKPLESISAAYHEGGWARNIFVGFLFTISAFLLAYNGNTGPEMILSKIASFAAIGIAMFPCRCTNHEEIIPGLHYLSASIMFLILAAFCYSFYKRAKRKGHSQALVRSYIYSVCGCTIVFSMALMALNVVLNEIISTYIKRLVFYGEAASLIAFGIAWLTASRCIPIITSKEEQLSFFPAKTNDNDKKA